MQRPKKDTTASDYLHHSAFTAAVVAADPETAGLELGLAAQHAALKQHVRAVADLEEERQRRRGVFRVRSRRCLGAVRSFELRLLDLVDKNRRDPLYRRYFPEGMRAVTRANPRTARPQQVRTILKSLGEDALKPDIGALSAELKPGLQAALAEVEAADKALTAVEEQVAYLCGRTIPERKVLWTDEYVKLHGALKVRFPRDAKRVESYYYPFKERKKAPPRDSTKHNDSG